MTGPGIAACNAPIDLTVVVTCYNEATLIVDTLEHVTAALQQAGCSYEIIVVDDHSRDNSVKRVREYMEQHPDRPIKLKVNERNQGLANNYVDAAFLGCGKYYRLCCGDDSESTETMVNIFRHIGKADMIIPCQIQKQVTGKSPIRRLASNVFTFLVNLVSGYDIKYYNGSAVHLRYNVMRWHPTSYGFGFQADIVTRLLDEGASYLQVASASVDRKGKASTALTLRNILSVGHTLVELSFRRVRKLLYGRQVKAREITLESGKQRLEA